jgi:hypothetical protein
VKKIGLDARRLSNSAVAERPIGVQSDSWIYDESEGAMRYLEKKPDRLLSYDEVFTVARFNEAPATADLPLGGVGLLACSRDQPTGIDYSEEAIPERDPAYRLTDGTLHETETVEHVPPEVRLALARCLEELGMSPARAALVANL